VRDDEGDLLGRNEEEAPAEHAGANGQYALLGDVSRRTNLIDESERPALVFDLETFAVLEPVLAIEPSRPAGSERKERCPRSTHRRSLNVIVAILHRCRRHRRRITDL
jgi:hypothetical protein